MSLIQNKMLPSGVERHEGANQAHSEFKPTNESAENFELANERGDDLERTPEPESDGDKTPEYPPEEEDNFEMAHEEPEVASPSELAVAVAASMHPNQTDTQSNEPRECGADKLVHGVEHLDLTTESSGQGGSEERKTLQEKDTQASQPVETLHEQPDTIAELEHSEEISTEVEGVSNHLESLSSEQKQERENVTSEDSCETSTHETCESLEAASENVKET